MEAKKNDLQQHLQYITNLEITRLNSNKILGVTAVWKDDTAHLSFYFDEKPTEEELDEASDVSTEIIAQMPKGMLEDHYIVIEKPDQLPRKFIAYKRKE